MEYFTIIFRTLFFYFCILLVYKLMGKREIGQLGIIDLIVSILIAEFAVISIENFDKSLLRSLVPIIVLTVLQILLAFLSLRVPKVRNFIDGNPSIIISEGIVNYKEMEKQKYNLEDLLVQIREKGYRTIEEIEYAILENNGTLSVFPKEENKKTPFPIPLIIEGIIQRETLKNIDKNERWVIEFLERKKIRLDDIYYAFYKNRNIFIIKNDDLK